MDWPAIKLCAFLCTNSRGLFIFIISITADYPVDMFVYFGHYCSNISTPIYKILTFCSESNSAILVDIPCDRLIDYKLSNYIIVKLLQLNLALSAYTSTPINLISLLNSTR